MEELKILPKLARVSILEELENKKLIDKNEWIKKYPFLTEKRACFVTLKIDNKLRGCIGSILPHRAFIDDCIENAKSAAFNDPRFTSLSKEEFDLIKIEVSVLTIPQKLEYEDINDLRSKIRPNVDGVILQLGNYQATFLPSVWEELPNFDLFFAHLCLKAGMSANCLQFHPTIYTYQAIEVEEN